MSDSVRDRLLDALSVLVGVTCVSISGVLAVTAFRFWWTANLLSIRSNRASSCMYIQLQHNTHTMHSLTESLNGAWLICSSRLSLAAQLRQALVNSTHVHVHGCTCML